MKNRDFIMGGILFHLNDNFPAWGKPPRGEYEGKYNVLYNVRGEQWESALLTVNTKKEAREEMERRAKNRDFPFDYFGYCARFSD